MLALALALGCADCSGTYDDGYDEGFALGAACRAHPAGVRDPCTECVFGAQTATYDREQDCYNDGRHQGWVNGTAEAGCIDTGDTGTGESEGAASPQP